MALEYRKFIDVRRNPEIYSLKPINKICTTIRYKFIRSEFYKSIISKRRDKSVRAIQIERQEVLTKFRTDIRNQLEGDEYFRKIKHTSSTKSVILQVNRKFIKRVDELQNSGELSMYIVERLKTSRTFLTVMPGAPIMIRVSKKIMIREDEYTEVDDDF